MVMMSVAVKDGYQYYFLLTAIDFLVFIVYCLIKQIGEIYGFPENGKGTQ
jgi:hypothetical protein